MTKFKVGDRVRTVNSGNGMNNSTPDGVEFVVSGASDSHDYGGIWYYGDPQGYGIWESRLELVDTAPETETTITVNHFWRPAGHSKVGWGFIRDEDVEWYLSLGHEVKRVTKTLTTTTEYLEPDDE